MKFYLFGRNISKSYSPIIHSSCFKRLGLPHSYQIKESDSIQEYLKLMEREDFGGASVTIPYKKSFDFVKKQGIAIKLDNINTIVKRNNQFYGYNTDYAGIAKCLDEISFKNVIVIGAGATSETVCHYLIDKNAQIVVLNRSKQRFQSNNFWKSFPNIQILSFQDLQNSIEKLKPFDLVINTVPNNANLKINKKILENGPTIMDVNYVPRETPFINYCIQNKCNKIIYGIQMLVGQGIYQNQLFTDSEQLLTQLYTPLIQNFK